MEERRIYIAAREILLAANRDRQRPFEEMRELFLYIRGLYPDKHPALSSELRGRLRAAEAAIREYNEADPEPARKRIRKHLRLILADTKIEWAQAMVAARVKEEREKRA